jgi:hypothetical protein
MEKGDHLEEKGIDGRMILIRYLIKRVRVKKPEKSEMGRACSAYEGGKRRIQCFGGKT